jgi:hypothetical protein
MVTDFASTFSAGTDCMRIVGSRMSLEAVDCAYSEARLRGDRLPARPVTRAGKHDLVVGGGASR